MRERDARAGADHGPQMPPSQRAIATLMLMASTSAIAGPRQHLVELGCYWYPIEDRSPVTNRTLSSLPSSTCTYVDIAGLCLFNVTEAGHLSWTEVQEPMPAIGQLGGTCLDLATRTAADARAAKANNPAMRFYWGMSGPMATMVRVYNDTSLRETLLQDLVNFTTLFPGIVDGLAFDYEVHCASSHRARTASFCNRYKSIRLVEIVRGLADDTTPADPHFCTHMDCFGDVKRGLTHFLRELKQRTGLGVNWWTGGLTWFANTADVAAVQPFIDHVELASYFRPDAFNMSGASLWQSRDAIGYLTENPHVMNPNDTTILIEDFGYTYEQLVLGLGLSAFSFMHVPRVLVRSGCVYEGYLGYSLPACNTSAYPAVYARTTGSHSSIGGDGSLPYTWDRMYVCSCLHTPLAADEIGVRMIVYGSCCEHLQLRVTPL